MSLTRTVLVGAAGAALLAGAAYSEAVSFTLVPSGGLAKADGRYSPQRLTLLAEKPAGLKKAPKGLRSPMYGALHLGPKESPKTFILVVDDPAGEDPKLFVDSNGNGDLTDDPPVAWTAKPYAKDSPLKMCQGAADFAVSPAMTVRLNFYKFDKADAQRAALKDVVLFYPDYLLEGKVTLGGKTYRAMLQEMTGTGDFRGVSSERGSSVRFLIDVDGDGKIANRGEAYDASKPFNIGGTTYELSGLTADGKFEIIKSSKEVAEIKPPADLGVGRKALTFKVKSTDGKEVSFPSTFKGKLVMLDFWATWCGPCKAELPGLVTAYNKYHEKGFEVLGISLDQANAEQKLADFTKENHMPWAQVYDGKYWSAEIASLYAVDSIPRAFLVDGDTGLIVASGNDLRGEALAGTIEKALAKKANP